MDTDELTYGSYLRVPELLALQQPRSRPPHPEELHFIVVHQALELWMKLLLHDLGRIVERLDADAFPGALALLGRVNHTLEHTLDQMRSLHSLPPWDLHQFRSYLGTASGSQSVQFRELELRSGLREPAYLKALEIEYGGALPEPLATRLHERSLADAHAAAAARLGIREVPEGSGEPHGGAPVGREGSGEPHGGAPVDREGSGEPQGGAPVNLASWADFYTDPGRRTDFYLVCEALVDYDERWARWRQEHVALVQRTLGDHARGTGGMAIAYLQRTTRYRFFPVLWALRDELVVRGGGQLVGRPRQETS